MQPMHPMHFPRLFRTGLRAARALLLAGLCAGAAAQEVAPDFYQDPGLYPNRDYVNQSFHEHIDPFTGALQLHYVDLFVPGNGGFDLKVQRAYNSAGVDPDNPYAFETTAGVGWTMHFGRVLRAREPNACVNSSALTVAGNPVLELPDGSRQLFAFPDGASPLMLSARRWRADCLGGGTGLAVYAPDGTRYDMTQKVNVGTGAHPVWAWYATQITDRNGNTARIAYADAASPEITRVSTSDGRSLQFAWADSGRAGRRITSVSAAGNTYRYDYQEVSRGSGKHFLTAVIRPDGTRWQYAYNGNLNQQPGSHLLNRVVYPQGGTLQYAWTFVQFDPQASPLGRTTVVERKTASDGGNWSFRYQPGRPGLHDTTTVTTPDDTIVYHHVGAGTVQSGEVWSIGLLMEKTIGRAQTETYTWDRQALSSENYFRPGAFVTKVDNRQFNAPVLSRKVVQRDGATHTTDYGNFDAWGNPGTMRESGPGGGTRTTQLTYYTNPTKWIVQQLQDERAPGRNITRRFDASGNLQSLSRDGVTTDWHHDTEGNVTLANFPRGLVHTYGQYRRGIAQLEQQPEGAVIRRDVSDAGNLTSETDGDGGRTTYDYDGLNRVTAVRPPVGSPVSIDWRADSRDASRGGLRETTTFDGFGRVTGVTLGGIARSFRVDALGRRTFASDPGAATGTDYRHDALGRVVRIGHADGSSRDISFGPGSTSVRDELGRTTTYHHRAYGNPDRTWLMGVDAPDRTTDITIGRDASDLVTSVRQGAVTRTYGYDGNNYLVEARDPETGVTSYGRDAAGNMTSRRVGGSGTANYTYDGQNRLSGATFPGDTPALHFDYNRRGLMTSATSTTARRAWDYDANGNLLHESLSVDGAQATASYRYNALDQLSGMTYPLSGRAVEFGPDILGRPTYASGYVNQVSYWPSGQVRSITYANGTTTQYDQNRRLWPSTFQTRGPTGVLADTRYDFDATGNLTRIFDTVDHGWDRQLGFDASDRLTQVSGPWSSGRIDYDALGNITAQTFGPYNLHYAYDGFNRLTQLTGTQPLAFEYDTAGNIARAGDTRYTFDGVPNLRCVNCNDPQQRIAYAYDPTGRRCRVERGGVVSYEMYDSAERQIAAFIPAQGQQRVESVYLAGKRVAQRVTAQGVDTVTYFHNDPAGSPLLATDATGRLLWKENYRPYGERLVNPEAAEPGAPWFTGKPFDPATGLSYMGGRYYAPLLGRFTGTDPKPVDPADIRSFNRYAYANNNPYRYVDPDGRHPVDAVFLAYDLAELAQAIHRGSGIGEAALYVGVGVFSTIYNPVPGTVQALKAARAVEHAIEAGRAGAHAGGEAATAAKGLAVEGRTVLGHFPEYRQLGEGLNARTFNIPDVAWNKMSEVQRWEANQKFLDRMIARGDEIILATPLDQVRPGSYFARELEYLETKGYVPSADGTRLIKP